ncbi:acetolactate decarboxylase [Ruficoccus amylovorans]|uniref:Alpha-acetolactate decarboxylase n=1 Tax=Ruficoccus amylovorans TaxID=1804625 RepID=A0A842HC93_9BACT|nr:acetolactate decarboxylase [Ruficoccus amylovorans]MBC2594105.1 acetolactate decarboxylase [Ruficoccus amylovorans]
MKALLALAFLLNISPFQEAEMTQYSTIDAFLSGVYTGELTVGELRQHGDFGIGTFDYIDGELFMLNGEVFQIPALGNAHKAADEMTIPFASFCTFKPTKTAGLNGPADAKAVRQMIEQRMFSRTNIFYAVKIDGTFSEVVARAPRKLSSPNAAISEITDKQSVFTFQNIEGTMIGFWCPKYINGINVGGWHMHFLSRDKTRGGHVLDYKIGQVDVAVMDMMNFKVILPREASYYQADLNLDRAEIRTRLETSGYGPRQHE